MMPRMVKEADLNRVEVPGDYEVLDATALGRRLGFKRDTVLAYLSRRNFRRVPRPNRLLAMGPIWYEKSVKEWEAKEEGRRRRAKASLERRAISNASRSLSESERTNIGGFMTATLAYNQEPALSMH